MFNRMSSLMPAVAGLALAGSPTFLFEAFDEPTQPMVNTARGIHSANGNLKPGIFLPSFISQ